MREHLHRASIQYKLFKGKRIPAMNTENVVTIQIDWSENSNVRQAQEEKSSYYSQDQYSIHAMRVWTYHGSYSYAALAEATDCRALAAVFATINFVLLEYINKGAREINIVSDSHSSQYRNKTAFWLISEFCRKSRVDIRWIYLEAGHGKCTPVKEP